MECSGRRFAPFDKVMQIANDYEKEVFIGDVGTIAVIDSGHSGLSVLFPINMTGTVGSREVVYGWGSWIIGYRPMPARFTRARAASTPPL